MAFEGLSEKLQNSLRKLTGRGRLTEQNVKDALREVRMALLEADVHYKVAKNFCTRVQERCTGQSILESLTAGQQVIKIVSEELTQVMGGQHTRLTWSSSVPTVFMLCGLQGSGKTTMAAKLALYLVSQGKKPMLAALDIYRPAAIKQLQVLGEQVKCPVFERGTQDPAVTAREAIDSARYYGRDTLILDTAGRLHIDTELMEELRRVKKTASPQEVLLVVDAMTGQDAVNAASAFDEALSLNGVILTKLDGDTRGGAALSIREVTGKPIKFSGIGERVSDLEPFHPDRMASRILGMGDVMTLIEKAQEAFDIDQADKLTRKVKTRDLSLDDFLEQLQQMKKMGSLQSVLSMLPGVGTKLKDVEIDENALKKPEAIIRSMTRAERANPNLLNASRRKRIASGSGTTVQDINALIRQFDQARQMMQKMRSPGKQGRARMPFL